MIAPAPGLLHQPGTDTRGRPASWPLNRTPPPDASTSCGSKPPGKPGKAPSLQLIGDCGALAKAGYTPMAMDNSVIGTYFPYRPILDQLIQKQFSELNHFTVTGAPGTAPELTTKDRALGDRHREVLGR